MAAASTQLSNLAKLQQRIATTRPAELVALRQEVAASIVAAQTIAQSASLQGTGQSTGQAELQAATAAAERTVTDFQRDFYERRIFDPYLQFKSADDERAYREREAERQREIERARAEHTPEGDLRAADLSIDQLHDAGAHGANRSPEYSRTMADLQKSRTDLARALPAATRASGETTRTTAASGEPPSNETAAFSPQLLAKLRGAGVSMPDQTGTGHGLTQSSGTSSGIVRT